MKVEEGICQNADGFGTGLFILDVTFERLNDCFIICSFDLKFFTLFFYYVTINYIYIRRFTNNYFSLPQVIIALIHVKFKKKHSPSNSN